MNAIYIFDVYCGYKPEPQQLVAQYQMILNQETAGCWARQLGKTLFTSLTSAFMSVVLGWKGIYRAPMKGQCDAPKEYWQSLPFWSGMSNDYVKFNGKKSIHLGPITDNTMRSMTADYIVYDEQAGCSKKQEQMILYGKKMIQNSPNRHLIRISTPIVGSSFEKDFYRLMESNAATRYTYQSFNQQSEWLQPAIAEILETEKLVKAGQYPLHLFKQETLAQFAPAGGAIFSNYEMKDLPLNTHFMKRYVGIDINPKFGHIAVLCTPLGNNTIYVFDEIELGVDTEYAAKQVMNMMDYRVSINFENNGAGQEAGKVFKKAYSRANEPEGIIKYVDWNEQSKIDRIMGMLENKFIFNKKASRTYEQFRSYAWDEKHKLRPTKTPDDHYIDSLLHACHFTNKHIGISDIAAEGY
jgi:hypothetical protein